MRSKDLGPAPGRPATTNPGLPVVCTDALDWSWPPYAPLEAVGKPFDTADWAPSSTVWRPTLWVGRWALLYRRSA